MLLRAGRKTCPSWSSRLWAEHLSRRGALKWLPNGAGLVLKIVNCNWKRLDRLDAAAAAFAEAEFFAHLDSGGGTSGVRVAVSGRYQCGAAEAVPLRLSAAVPVGGERMTVIVGAFQEAFDSVMEDLLKSI